MLRVARALRSRSARQLVSPVCRAGAASRGSGLHGILPVRSSHSTKNDPTVLPSDLGQLTVHIPLYTPRIPSRQHSQQPDQATGIDDGKSSEARADPAPKKRGVTLSRQRRRARRLSFQRGSPRAAPVSRIRPSVDRRETRRGKGEARQAASTVETTDVDLRDLDVPIDPFAPSEAENEGTIPRETLASGRIEAGQVKIEEVKPLREMKVARLAHGLSRVLFSPGVHPTRDIRTGVWNFHQDFITIPTPEEFAFDRTPKYVTPSQDEELLSLAEKEDCRFIGSTSTLTQAFSHIYFAISGGKGVDLSTFSQSFASERSDFTSGAELPACLTLGPLSDGRYYVDSDKQYDTENILSEYGVILEKQLVTPTQDFKRFLNSSPPESVSEAERNEKEAYRYSKFGKLMMRSQLDCQDDRLPGSGVFDIKTRACLPIRHDRANHAQNNVYSILKDKGSRLSFEKEYYDIVRAGMLKWSMQARIGGMDGIFVAYHNTKRLFGFQYLPMAEIDERLFGSTEMGTQAFNLVVSLFEALVEHCTDAFPGQELSVVIRRSPTPEFKVVTAYVTPTGEGEGEQPIQAIQLEMSSYINGRRITRLLDNETTPDPQAWSVDYKITKSAMDEASQNRARQEMKKAIREVTGISSVSVPEGKSVEEMSAASPGIRWKKADRRITELREEAKKSGTRYAELKKGWKPNVFAWTSPK